MQRQASKSVLFLTVFIDLVGFGIVLPLLPFFANHFGVSKIMVAGLSSVFSLMQFLCAPLWGRLSDRIGRRPVLLITLAGSTISYLALGFCTNYWQVFGTRVLAGIFGGNIAVATAYMADITPLEKRSQGMGLIGAAFGLGFVLGPGIGALIAHFAENPAYPEQVYHAIGGVAGLICGINFLVACWTLVESRPSDVREKAKTAALQSMSLQQVLSIRIVGFLILLYFVVGFAFANFENFFALLIHQNFQFGVKEGSYFFLFIGLVVATVQGGLIGRLVKKFGEPKLIIGGCILSAFGIILIPFSHHVWHILIALTGLGLGQGLNRSSILGLISQNISADEQGAVLGVAQSSGSLARIVGPIIGGMLFDHVGAAVPFVCAGLLVLVTLVLSSPMFVRKTA
jgi:MFS transporter, DHA1 family, tetracycline resistance protein